ncbi:MAG: hypothetical protein Fur0010_14550 [Bdellovibrio sp.]
MAHYMKFYALLILFSVSAHAASVKKILHCLGNEELTIHKAKTDGPVYFLNQLFINELSSFNDVEVKESELNKICQQKDFAPSVFLLYDMLLRGKEIFIIQIHKGEEGLWSYKNSQIEDLLNRVPHIFFQYLAHLQTLLPTHDCLNTEIPEINFFMERYHYLETDFSTEKLIKDKSKIKSIFEKLKILDKTILKCQKIAKERYEKKHKK